VCRDALVAGRRRLRLTVDVEDLEALGLEEPGLNRVIRATYDLLGYMSFFTVGEDECRAWSIPRGTVAQAAAGEIHSDIQRGFIRAEVTAYDRLVARGSLAASVSACRSWNGWRACSTMASRSTPWPAAARCFR